MTNDGQAQNFLWTDFIFSNDCFLRFIKERTLRVQKIIAHAPHSINFEKFDQKFSRLLERISNARVYLRSIENEYISQGIMDRYLHYEFEDSIKKINEGYSDLIVVLTQKAFRQRLDFPSEESDIDRLLRVPDTTKIAVEKYSSECNKVIYGRKFSSRSFSLIPTTICGPYSRYQYFSASKFISIPQADATKLCRWSVLAHETFHSKIDDVLMALDMVDQERKDGEDLLNSLIGTPWNEAHDRLKDLEDKVIDLLKLKIAEIYRQLFLGLQDEFTLPRYFLEFQFIEILCDTASTLVSGPSDLIFLSTKMAESCRNPLLGIRRHLLDLWHPPDTVRIRYLFDILQIGDTDLRRTKRDVIGYLGDVLDELIGCDLLNKETTKGENLATYLINTYSNVIHTFMPQIVELVSSLIDKEISFNRNRWKASVDAYEEIVNGQEPIDSLRPYDLTNIAWLKVIDVFEDCKQSKGNLYDYYYNRREEEPFFRRLWDFLISSKVKSVPTLP